MESKTSNSKSIKRFLIIMLMAFITTLALFINPYEIQLNNTELEYIYRILYKIKNSLTYLNINSLFTFIFILYFYNNNYLKKRKCNKWYMFLSILFSIFIVLGYSFSNTNSLLMVFNGTIQLVKSIIRVTGYSFIIYILIEKLLDLLKWIGKIKETNNKYIDFIFNKHPKICIPIILILLWLPFLVITFPGIIGWDAVTQIKQLLGEYQSVHVNIINPNVTLNNHHPIITTLLYGLFIEIGKMINSVDLGFYLFIIFQVSLMIYVIYYCIKIIGKMGLSNNIKMAVLIFFGLCPLVYIPAVNILKDVLFGIVMFYYVLLLIEILLDNEVLKNKRYILKLCITIFLVIMVRNNGLYSILFSFPFMIIVIKKYRKAMIIALILPLLVNSILNNVVYPKLQIASGSIKEALSIPFQQTARTLYEGKKYKDEDLKIISKILDVNVMKENYNPTLSDPVKNSYKLDTEKKDLLNYFGVWFKYLFKYPITYIEAGLNTTYGYWYPNKTDVVGYFNIREDFVEENPYDMKYLNKFKGERKVLHNIYNHIIVRIPVIGTILTSGFYTWLLLIMSVYIFTSKKKEFIIPILSLLTITLVCIASPYFSMRYMYSIVYSMPILICTTIYLYKENKILKKKRKKRG